MACLNVSITNRVQKVLLSSINVLNYLFFWFQHICDNPVMIKIMF